MHAGHSRQPASRPQRRAVEHGPLAGFTVGVTAARRADELGALLQRRGAAVLHAPALRIVPLADDSELLAATKELIDQAPDVVVATTAIGFRGWVEAADGWGLGEAAAGPAAAASNCWPAGPRCKGAVRAAGLTEEWSPSSPSPWPRCSTGCWRRASRGAGSPSSCTASRCRGSSSRCGPAGAEVVGVPVYRWMPPEDIAPVDRLLDAARRARAGRGHLHQRARRPPRCCRGRRSAGCCGAARARCGTTCCRPASARSPRCRCRRAGVDTVQPERFRLGPLVQLLCQELPGRARALPVAGHRVEIRGHAVLVDGELRPVPPAGMALLRALARRPGWVVAAAGPAAGAAGGGAGRACRGDGDGPAADGAGRAEADPDGGQARATGWRWTRPRTRSTRTRSHADPRTLPRPGAPQPHGPAAPQPHSRADPQPHSPADPRARVRRPGRVARAGPHRPVRGSRGFGRG